jgi:hypothetical protein
MKKLLRKLSNLLESCWKSIKKCFSSCLTIDSPPHNHNIQISQPCSNFTTSTDKQSNDKYYPPKSPKYITLSKSDWHFLEKQSQEEYTENSKKYTENPKKKEPKGKTSDYLTTTPSIKKRKVKSSSDIYQQQQKKKKQEQKEQKSRFHYKKQIRGK